jgi:tetratricopeptide (TPR) repeat protein
LQIASTSDVFGRTNRPAFFGRAIEGTWLAAAFLVPLLVMHEDAMAGFIQMPKVFAFRSLAVVLVILLAFEWAFTTNVEGRTRLDLDGPFRRAWASVRVHPGRLVVFATGAILVATLISVSLSPVKSIAFWGIDPGWDTYGLANVLPYMLYFSVLAVRLRSREQIERFIWTLTSTSILISIYGVGQHWGIDPLRTVPTLVDRVGLTFGNPIFGAAYLIMTIPLTLAVFLPYRTKMPPLSHVWIGAGLITIQLTALTFTFSRGPWIGFLVGGIAFALVFAFVYGWREVRRPGAIFGVALLFVVLMNAIPVADAPDVNPTFGQTVGSIAPDVAGGLNNRWTIWNTALDVYFSTPWPDTESYPEIPDLAVPWLRPIVGYGPDMFGYAYPLVGDTVYTRELASHGHNFIIHTLVELGLLGVLAYISLFVAVGVVLVRLLRKARAGLFPSWFSYLVIAMASVILARGVEQIPGKAQIADLHLMWMLVGFAVVLAAIAPRLEQAPTTAASADESAPGRRRTRRVRRETSSASLAGVSIPRVVLAGVIAVLGLVLWSQAIVNQIQAAVIAADAHAAGAAGQTDRAIELSMDAINAAPSAPIHKINLGELYFQLSLQTDRALSQRVDFLQDANALVKEVSERNPMDHRAWSRSGEYQRELAVLIPADAERAVYDNSLLVHLMPGFWQARTALAWAYVRVQQYEGALRTVQEAKDVRILESAGAHLAYYIQGTALQRLGREDEARAALHCSLSYNATTQAINLLEQLGEVIENEYTLDATDFAICPEQTPS